MGSFPPIFPTASGMDATRASRLFNSISAPLAGLCVLVGLGVAALFPPGIVFVIAGGVLAVIVLLTVRMR